MVHHASRAALTLAAGALALSGCLGGSSSGGQPAKAGARIGTTLNLANCTDWRKASPGERDGIVRDLRAFASGPTGESPGRHGATLPDDKAYQLLDNTCKQYYARGFKLYKLYTRGAALQNIR